MLHSFLDWCDPASIAQVLAYLHRKLNGRYTLLDPHLLDESIEDALVHYRRCPQGFDLSRGVPLYYYLELRARHSLDKKLQKVMRRRRHEQAAGVSETDFEKLVSEVRVRGGIYIGRDRSEHEAEERQEEIERQKEVSNAIASHLNPRDRAGVR